MTIHRLISRKPARRRATAAMLTAAAAAALGLAAVPALASAASPGRPAHLAQASALPKYVMWDLGSDFGITATNPQPDSYGDPGVWSWLQGSQLPQPSTFTPLNIYSNQTDNIAGLDSWQGTFQEAPGFPNLPAVAINASGAVIDGSTPGVIPSHFFYPKNAMIMHPAPSDDAIVGWTSPVAMTVKVTLTLAKLDWGCGDGITWRLADGGVKLASGAISVGGPPQGTVRTLAVSAGTTIYLEIGPGPGQDYGCDSTGVSMMITGHR
jgi:hypothetical protein